MGGEPMELLAPATEPSEAGLLAPDQIADGLPLPASRARMIAGTVVLGLPVVVTVGLLTGSTAVALALAVAKVAWPFALIAGTLVWLRNRASVQQRFMLRAAAVSHALDNWQLRQAEDLCRAQIADARRQPSLAALARLKLASVQRVAGDLAAATATLLEVDAQRGLAAMDVARGGAAAELAYVLALRGELDAARGWMRRTDLWMQHAGPWRSELAASRARAAMAIAARAGDFDACARAFDDALPALERRISLSQMKVVWALRAFAAARENDPRGIGAAEPWLRHLRGARPDEIDYLGAAWPDMRAFLAAAT